MFFLNLGSREIKNAPAECNLWYKAASKKIILWAPIVFYIFVFDELLIRIFFAIFYVIFLIFFYDFLKVFLHIFVLHKMNFGVYSSSHHTIDPIRNPHCRLLLPKTSWKYNAHA